MAIAKNETMSDTNATYRPDPLDEDLISALITHRHRVARAAAAVGISRAGAYRRLAREGFRQKYAAARARYLAETVNELARRRAGRLAEAIERGPGI
jgi:hypothetical protein